MNNQSPTTPSYPPLDNLTFYSMLSILQGGMWMLNDIEEFLKQYNISHGRFSILLLILETKEHPIMPMKIAKKLGKSRPTITKMLEKLQKEGFLTSKQSNHDGRAKTLTFTGKAIELLNICVPEYNKRVAAMSAGLTDKEKLQLMNLVAKINFLDTEKKIVVKS